MQTFVGSLMVTGFGFAPKGFSPCNGQIVSIGQNQALFSLLGTRFGGNGVQTFGLPNLQGRAAVGMGNGFNLGESAGEASHILLTTEMPLHNHNWMASSNAANNTLPAGNLLAQPSNPGLYTTAPNTTMSQAEIGNTGGQPHENRQPYLVMNWCIALVGIFPARS